MLIVENETEKVAGGRWWHWLVIICCPVHEIVWRLLIILDFELSKHTQASWLKGFIAWSLRQVHDSSIFFFSIIVSLPSKSEAGNLKWPQMNPHSERKRMARRRKKGRKERVETEMTSHSLSLSLSLPLSQLCSTPHSGGAHAHAASCILSLLLLIKKWLGRRKRGTNRNWKSERVLVPGWTTLS